jgi:hypothetical protein
MGLFSSQKQEVSARHFRLYFFLLQKLKKKKKITAAHISAHIFSSWGEYFVTKPYKKMT